MTSEALETVELGQAEALIEFGMTDTHNEAIEKYIPTVAPYVEFE